MNMDKVVRISALTGLGVVVFLLGYTLYYAVFSITKESDLISYHAPCWGEKNKIYFIKKVAYGKAIINPSSLLNKILYLEGDYLPEKTEVYVCSMNYDGSNKKEIVKLCDTEIGNREYGDTKEGSYWLPRYMDWCSANNLLLISGGDIPGRGETSQGVYTMKINGQDKRRLSETGVHASWSPDGKKIAYEIITKESRSEKMYGYKEPVEYYDEENTIWVMNSDGSDKHQISREKILTRTGRWVRDEQGKPVMENGKEKYVWKEMYEDTDPIWSPRGDLIAFVCKGWIYTMKPDGSERRKVIDSSHLAGWTVDGKMLFVGGKEEGGSEHAYNWFVDLNGNIVKKVAYWGKFSLDGSLLRCTLDIIYNKEGEKLPLKEPFPEKEKYWQYKRPNNIW
ncbi:MAG: hypothetical protein AB1422_15205 [bacterium]